MLFLGALATVVSGLAVASGMHDFTAHLAAKSVTCTKLHPSTRPACMHKYYWLRAAILLE